MWDAIVEFANASWNLWLFLLFLLVVAYALWPSKRRQKQMDEASRIPLEDDEPKDDCSPSDNK